MDDEHPGVKALRQGREKAKEAEALAIERLAQMPIPPRCAMWIYRCSKCKTYGALVYMEEYPEVAYFYDPCACALEWNKSRSGKVLKHVQLIER
jgi:hypothetical protein